jgi:hypothetical protein
MVMTSLDRFGAQNLVKVVAVWLLIYPISDSVEHGAMDLDRLVPESRVVESAENIIHHFVNRNPRVLPGIKNSSTM